MPNILKHLPTSLRVLLLVATAFLSACGGGGDQPPGDDQTSLSNDARLAGIELSHGSLDQALQASQYEYTASVGFLLSSIEVSANAAHRQASLSINDTELTAGSRLKIPLDVGSNKITVVVTAEDGTQKTYTVDLTRDSIDQFTQQAYAKASNTDADDRFGYSVTIDGDVMVVGAAHERSNGSDETDNNVFVNAQFGWSVDIDKDTIVIGAKGENSGQGSAYVFVRNGNSWTQQARLQANNPANSDVFGRSVAIDGDTVAVGASGKDSLAGAGYIFQRSGNSWNLHRLSFRPAMPRQGMNLVLISISAVTPSSSVHMVKTAKMTATRSTVAPPISSCAVAAAGANRRYSKPVILAPTTSLATASPLMATPSSSVPTRKTVMPWA